VKRDDVCFISRHPVLLHQKYACAVVTENQVTCGTFRVIPFTVCSELPFALACTTQAGRVVRKPVNANPGLKVKRGKKFSSIKMFSTAYVLCSLRSLKLKTEGQIK